MKKPLIGVTPLIDIQRESLWMVPGYMNGIAQAGGIPIMLPLTDEPATIKELTELCDGFLFTGGQGVSPEVYGAKKLAQCGECSKERDSMELRLLKEALGADKPILGICRGIQFLNAALGGTLYQDLPTQHPSELEHHQSSPYDVPIHDVMLKKGSPLHKLLQTDIIAVNSYHHQAIKDLAKDLSVMATSADGLVEAVYHPGRQFVWAVQWHPEFAYQSDENCRKIFEAFIKVFLPRQMQG